MTQKIIIKLLASKTSYVNHFALRQCPNGVAEWGNVKIAMDADTRQYDWLVVYHDLPAAAEMLACPSDRTILVTHEPPAVKTYGSDFCGQFGHVLTCHRPIDLPHPQRFSAHPGSMWFYGADFYEPAWVHGSDSYDAAPSGPFSHNAMKARSVPSKNKLLSTVCSDKKQKHTMHWRRWHFTQALKKHIPEMEIFGHGVRQINQKADALDDYRYHLTIENDICPHYWTEKLADAFLGFCLPFYIGAPNVAEYFPPQSFIPLDINDPHGAAILIRRAIDDDEYQKRLPHIVEARRRVLEEHNLYAMLARIIPTLPAADKKPNKVIYARRALMKRNPLIAARYLYEKAAARRQHIKRYS